MATYTIEIDDSLVPAIEWAAAQSDEPRTAGEYVAWVMQQAAVSYAQQKRQADLDAAADAVRAGDTATATALLEAVAQSEAGQTPLPSRTVVTAQEFFDRFTPEERLAVSTATLASPELNVGLVNGLAAGRIDVSGAEADRWIDGLVQAGAVAAERKAEILKPKE